MSYFAVSLSSCLGKASQRNLISSCQRFRQFCEFAPKASLEKSVNKVTLLGRVGIDPQLRGSENKPCVIFTLATNTNYKYETGEIQQKTDWHKITVFKPYLRQTILDNLKKGARVYIDGRILYGEFCDAKGITHNTTTIIANDVIFVGNKRKEEEIVNEDDIVEAT